MSAQQVVIPIKPVELKEYFFRAMLESGFVSDIKPARDQPMPGWKKIDHNPFQMDGYLHLADMWHTTPDSDWSSGITMIYWKWYPVWVMHYGGWYKEQVIPSLRAALKYSYERGEFIGGRGPMFYRADNVVYTNEAAGSFFNFSGREIISADTSTGTMLGTHWYQGMWLLGQQP